MVVIGVLGDGFIIVFVLLVDKRDGYCLRGGKCRGVGQDSVAGAEGDIAECYGLCFSGALRSRVFARPACEKERAIA